jgi:2,4-dienoyl-CoA reductase-like NADH-dependent reductase (Old Yellow Enzyme family)
MSSGALAYQCGFDGVDIKSCHAICFPSGWPPTPDGRYGGSFEIARAFLLDVRVVCARGSG